MLRSAGTVSITPSMSARLIASLRPKMRKFIVRSSTISPYSRRRNRRMSLRPSASWNPGGLKAPRLIRSPFVWESRGQEVAGHREPHVAETDHRHRLLHVALSLSSPPPRPRSVLTELGDVAVTDLIYHHR